MSAKMKTMKIQVQEEKELSRIDESAFSKELDLLIKESEELRFEHMKSHRTRTFISTNIGILCVCLGVGASAWYFLMEANILIAFLSVLISIIPPVMMNFWANAPLENYKKKHKTEFMPKLAKTLNGLSFYPERGVSEKIINRLAVIPAYDEYKAEDCFMGVYKGAKIIFSEARLYAKRRPEEPIFDGIFVLLETQQEVFEEGHTIITANHKMVKNYEKTRWKDLQRVHVSVSDPSWDKFEIFSTNPENAELFIGDRLLKELAEAAEVFDDAPLTAVLFKNKYVFVMIPYDHDMFETSNLFVPVTTKTQAMQCKKEIEQLLEIIDVFDLYKPIETT